MEVVPLHWAQAGKEDVAGREVFLVGGLQAAKVGGGPAEVRGRAPSGIPKLRTGARSASRSTIGTSAAEEVRAEGSTAAGCALVTILATVARRRSGQQLLQELQRRGLLWQVPEKRFQELGALWLGL